MRKLFTKLFIIFGLLIMCLVLVAKKDSAFAATLTLNPAFGEVKAGDDLKVEILVKGEDELIDGVDANIAYDTDVLKVKEMKQGEFFSNYPILKDDNGQVKITALAPKDGVKIFGDIVVANLVFEVLDSSDTKLTIAYEEGATSESNVAGHGTAGDLLKGVSDGSYKVTASPEKLQEARIKKARQSGLIPVLLFIVLIAIVGFAIWYYRRKKKPQEDYFVPEEFPMDKVPESEPSSSKDPNSPPSV